MGAYRFKATGRDGQAKQGIIQASSLQDAEQRVAGRGWTPVLVQEAKLVRPRETALPVSSKKKTAIVLLTLILLLSTAGFVYLDPWNLFPFLQR